MTTKPKPILTIGHLYPNLMNTYGDRGNILALVYRLRWRGFTTRVREFSLGDSIAPGACDIYMIGGGQDNAQTVVGKDLLATKADILRAEVEAGTVFLAICGGYQLLGESYLDHQGRETLGVGALSIKTVAGPRRMVGHLLIESPFVPSRRLVGFENHSGRTQLADSTLALGRVLYGFGNNGKDQTEGIRYKNVFGTYLHGSVLTNNPELTDLLLTLALHRHDPAIVLEPLNDSVERLAATETVSRFS